MSALSMAKLTSPTFNSNSIKDSANRSNLNITKHMCHIAINHTRLSNMILTSQGPPSYPLLPSQDLFLLKDSAKAVNTIKLTSSDSLNVVQEISRGVDTNMPGTRISEEMLPVSGKAVIS